jgi:pre-mRNA 3'-end-processing factor FIP1
VVSKLPTTKKEASTKGATQVSGADLPGIATSKIDVNAKPIYEPAGKPITQVNIDEGILHLPFPRLMLTVSLRSI